MLSAWALLGLEQVWRWLATTTMRDCGHASIKIHSLSDTVSSSPDSFSLSSASPASISGRERLIRRHRPWFHCSGQNNREVGQRSVHLVTDLVGLPENLFAQPDANRIPLFQQLHLHPTNRDPSFGLAAIHYLGEGSILPPPLDRARCDFEPGSDLFVRALHFTETF